MMTTMDSQHVSAAEFETWLGRARAGDKFVYFSGPGLCEAIARATLHRHPNGTVLQAAGNRLEGARARCVRICPRTLPPIATRPAKDSASSA